MGKKRVVRKKTKKKRTSSNDPTKKIAVSMLLFTVIGILAFIIYNKYCDKVSDRFNSDKYIVKGIDVSHHNPILNWEIIMEQGISFAYIKATESISHEDRNYPYNYDLAKKTNIKVGSYHFYTFGLSGLEQARHFIKKAKHKKGDLIPAIDVEHSPANPYSKDEQYITLVVHELRILEQTLYEYFGVRPIIYTNKDCYKLYIKDNFRDNLIWMCDLHNEPSDNIKNWRIWQFSHEGNLPGIEGKIDFNYYRFSFDQLKELLLP